MTVPHIARKTLVDHGALVAFADGHVNLHQPERARKRAKVTELRERLEKKIKDDPTFPLVKMRHAGSVEKGTALSHVTDLDVAVYCDEPKAPVKDSELVHWMTERLKDAYPDLRAQITAETHCAAITLSPSLKVDVVPVLYEGAANDVGYLVSKDDGERLLTSVSRHLEFVRKRKDEHPGDYAQVVRFVKWWTRLRKDEDPDNFRCKSFLVELIVAHLADGGAALADYPEALLGVFAYIAKSGLRERIAFMDYYGRAMLPGPTGKPIEVFDPVNPSNNVCVHYTEAQRIRLVDSAAAAVDAITEAIYASTRERAIRCWQAVLGPTFRGTA